MARWYDDDGGWESDDTLGTVEEAEGDDSIVESDTVDVDGAGEEGEMRAESSSKCFCMM